MRHLKPCFCVQFLIVLAFCTLGWSQTPAPVSETPPNSGSEAPSPAVTTTPEETPAPVEPRQPTVPSGFFEGPEDSEVPSKEGLPLYLMNREGRLVAVPGIQLEYLDELLRSQPGTGAENTDSPQLPDFIFHSVAGEARVEKDALRTTVTFRIETFRNYPVSVPLRFDEGILLEEPKKVVESSQESDNPLVATVQQARESVPVAREYRGEGRLWVEFSEKNGFTAWIVGKGVHEVTLTFLVPYSQSVSGEKQLRVQIPYTTMSEMVISIPQTRSESERFQYSMTGGTSLQAPKFVPGVDSSGKETSDGLTQLSLIRMGGELWLSWNELSLPLESAPSVLESEALILATIGRDEIRYDARLKILRRGDEMEAFRVRLPENAELLPVRSADYTIDYVTESPEESEVSRRPLVEIRTKKQTSGVLRVDIHAKVMLTAGVPTEWFDMSGFEVLSAVRQSGYYAVKVAPGTHPLWSFDRNLRRLEELPVALDSWVPVANQTARTPEVSTISGEKETETETTVESESESGTESEDSDESETPETSEESEASEAPKAPEVPGDPETSESPVEETPAPAVEETPSLVESPETWEAVFEFEAQPVALSTRIIAKTTRVNVEPKYVVRVSRGEMILEATWNCTIRGGRISWIDMDLGDWTFVSAGPDSLVAGDRLELDGTPRISIPFVQPAAGHILLTFRARREIPQDVTSLAIGLPKIVPNTIASVVTTSTPAELKILPDSNLELTPDVKQCVHLVRQPTQTPSTLGQTSSFAQFLYRCESENARFVAAMRVHPRLVGVRQYSQVEVFRQEYRVRQTFEFTVSYESLSQLRFLIPKLNPEQLDIQVVSQIPGGTQLTLGNNPYVVRKPVVEERSPSILRREEVPTGVVTGEEIEVVPPVSPMPVPDATLPGSSVVPPIPGGAGVSVPAPVVPSVTPPVVSKRPILKIKNDSDVPSFMDVDVLLPEEKLGNFAITLSYALPISSLKQNEKVPVAVQLASVECDELLENQLECGCEDSLILALNSDEASPETLWEENGQSLARSPFFSGKENVDKLRSVEPVLRCATRETRHVLPLLVEWKETQLRNITIIDRFWLQTWLTGKNRQDRCVFLFPPIMDVQEFRGTGRNPSQVSGAQPSRTFVIHLPQQASADEAEVWIDRQSARFGSQLKRLSANTLQVTLQPTSNPNMLRTVEIRYQFEESLPREGAFSMEVPYVENVTWIRGIYWQLLFPSNTHVFTAPQNFSMEYRWGWNQCFWGRMPIWEQEALESWAGALRGTPVPSRMNRYVFAGMGANDIQKQKVTFFLLNRTAVVIVLAFVVLWMGALFMYFRFLRRPGSLLCCLVALGAFALKYPELALLGLQAITLGVILLMVSMFFGLSRLTRREFAFEGVADEEPTVMCHAKAVITPSSGTPEGCGASPVVVPENAEQVPSSESHTNISAVPKDGGNVRTETFEQDLNRHENASTVIRKK